MSDWLRTGAAFVAALSALAVVRQVPPPHGPQAGVVVESLEASGVAHAAGVRVGDRLVSWRTSGPAHRKSGLVQTPFDLGTLEVEEAPLCPVTLRGWRGGGAVEFTLVEGDWRLQARPAFPDAQRVAQERARRSAAQGRVDEGIRRWKELAAELEGSGRPGEACWVWTRVGTSATGKGLWAEAETGFDSARTAARAVGDRMLEAVWAAEGRARFDAADVDRAERAYRSALAIQEELAPEGLGVAARLYRLGRLADERNSLERAEALIGRSLAIRTRLAPGSLSVARSLNLLGAYAFEKRDLDTAQRLYGESLGIAERCPDAGEDVASALSNLGNVAHEQGDFVAAEAAQRRALHIFEVREPGSLHEAMSLSNLATVELRRGNLEEAERLQRKALEVCERLPGSRGSVAVLLNNLGVTLSERGDIEAATGFFTRALTLAEELAPDSHSVRLMLVNVGEMMWLAGDLSRAEEFYTRALTLGRRLVPDSVDVARSLHHLAQIADKRGRSVEAERLWEEARSIYAKAAPNGPGAALATEALASSLSARGGLERAESLQRRALQIRLRLPGTASLAKSWHGLALALWRSSRRQEALSALERCLEALEAQQGRLGGSEDVRSGFAAQYAGYYRDTLALLIELGRPREAFHVLERSRARSLLAMVAERDLVFADIPLELDRERRKLDADYDRTQARIGDLDPGKDAATIEDLQRHLRELRDGRARIGAQVRNASPRLAALRYPAPLDVEGAGAALDAGTVLFSYSVGEKETFLFVLTPRTAAAGHGLLVFTLPFGQDALRQRITAFRSLIESGREHPEREADLREAGAKLYDDLVRPAEAALGAARRVLLSPDGPLHLLPFAALVASRGPARYWAETKPLHSVLSATLYAELRSARRSDPASPPAKLAVFADPSLSTASARPAAGREGVVARSRRLARLPWAQEEAQRIAGLFGPAAVAYVGAQATERQMRALGPGLSYVHFATHGLLDRRFPLDSALVLSPSQRPEAEADNGLLQAWEIFESLRLDADLVTLSACDTGLGREAGGEGLLSLSRAFQYAGARSVLASLWSVSDRSTSELMVRFYDGLRRGLAKDEALQAAQVALIQGRGTAHPFHWAGFELNGDWR